MPSPRVSNTATFLTLAKSTVGFKVTTVIKNTVASRATVGLLVRGAVMVRLEDLVDLAEAIRGRDRDTARVGLVMARLEEDMKGRVEVDTARLEGDTVGLLREGTVGLLEGATVGRVEVVPQVPGEGTVQKAVLGVQVEDSRVRVRVIITDITRGGRSTRWKQRLHGFRMRRSMR